MTDAFSKQSVPGFHVVIPARYESTRLPGKPLVDIAGQPMIVRCLLYTSPSPRD